MRQFWRRIATVVLLGVALAVYAAFTEKRPPQELDTIRVDSGPVISYLRATGSVSSTHDVRLSVAAGGAVQGVSVAVGSLVQPGQELLKLETQDAQLQLAADQLAVREAQAGVEHQQREIEGLRADLAAGAVSRLQVGQAEDKLALLRIQHEKAAARVTQTQARIRQSTLRSPIAGLVTDVGIRPGEMAVAGQPVITLSDRANQQILARLEQNDAQDLRVDMPVRIALDGSSGQGADEHIVRIEPAMRKDGSASYTAVWISLNSATLRLRPNQQVDVRIPIGTGKPVARLPLEALVSSNDKTAVWTLDLQGALRLLPVTIGAMGDRYAEVLSGVAPGQVLALAGGRTLKEGELARAATAPRAP